MLLLTELLAELLLKLQLLFYLLASADVATATADAVAATGGVCA